jgi:hypothetical protein
MGIEYVTKYVGEQGVPQDVKRRRRSVYDAMRRFGTPVLVKHMFNPDDAKEGGIATTSPGFDPVYGQSRNRDPLSHGVGYVSNELSDDEWYHTTTGVLVQSRTSPGSGYARAPKYRGFGKGYLIYMIQPDRAEDFFKVDPVGTFIKIQSAMAQAPWYPEINDNDLIINVVLDGQGRIMDTRERYQAKMSSPVSVRGLDRRGRREYTEDGGNRHVVNQQFEMALVPDNDVLYNVEVDR